MGLKLRLTQYIPSLRRLTCYVPSSSIDMTTSRAILATPHPSPPTANGSQCRLFAFASSSLAFPQLSLRFSPAFPTFFPSFKSNKQRHRQEGKRKHGKCQHTLKRLANGDNVKHERSEWSVQSGESWWKQGESRGLLWWGHHQPPVTIRHPTVGGHQRGWRTLAKWVAIKWLEVPLAFDDGVGSQSLATKNKYEHTNCRSHLFTLLWRNFQGGAAGWFRVIPGVWSMRWAGPTNGTIVRLQKATAFQPKNIHLKLRGNLKSVALQLENFKFNV